MFPQQMRFVAAEQGVAFGRGKLGFQMRAHQTQLAAVVDFYRYIQETAPHFLRDAVCHERHIRSATGGK